MRNIAAAAKSSTATLPQAASLDWRAALGNVRQPLAITNNVAKAAQLCALGQPAIAVLGVSEAELTAWLRARGAHVVTKGSAH
jgi:hypothetical protein